MGEMSTAPVNKNNVQVELSKNIVLDSEQFDENRTKFEDWWREIRLFFKSNQVLETNDRVTVILAYLREGIASIYAQKKLGELDKEMGIQNWVSDY